MLLIIRYNSYMLLSLFRGTCRHLRKSGDSSFGLGYVKLKKRQTADLRKGFVQMDLLNNKNLKKKTDGFTILSGDSTDGHGGYGVGTLNLDNITPVFVDPAEEEVFVDLGALHARSAVEKRIKFLKEKDKVPNGKLYWLVWVTISTKEGKPYYGGVAGCEMLVDTEIRRGYKSMPEHVNKMDKSLKGKILVDDMDKKSRVLLAEFLKNHNEDMWNRSEEELHVALAKD